MEEKSEFAPVEAGNAPSSALRLPAEVWQRIFKMVREVKKERYYSYERPKANLRICKTLLAPALSALYENIDIGIAAPGEDVDIGFKDIPEKHLHYVKGLKIAYLDNFIDCDFAEWDIDFYKQHEAKPAAEIAQNILKVLRKTPDLKTLSLGFTCLERISEKLLLQIGQEIVKTHNLRDLEIWAPKFGWFVDLIVSLHKTSKLQCLVMQAPFDMESEEVLAGKLAKGGVMPVRSLTLGWPHDYCDPDMPNEFSEDDWRKKQTAATQLFGTFAAKGQLEHFCLADPHKNSPFDRYGAFQRSAPFTGAFFLAQVLDAAVGLKKLEIDIDVAGFPEDYTPAFNNLKSLTSLRLVAFCDYFFELDESALPPALTNFTAAHYEGKLKPVMAALANKDWLPNLETFDLTFNDEHQNIEYAFHDFCDNEGKTFPQEDMHVWLDSNRSERHDMSEKALKKHISEFGRALSEFATEAKSLCAARNVGHQNDEDDFFWKFTLPY